MMIMKKGTPAIRTRLPPSWRILLNRLLSQVATKNSSQLSLAIGDLEFYIGDWTVQMICSHEKNEAHHLC